MADILVKDIIAGIIVVIPSGWVAKLFVQKWINDMSARQDKFEDILGKIRKEIVGIPVHELSMDNHSRRMDNIERLNREETIQRDKVLEIMGNIIDKKADSLGVDAIRDDVREIKQDVAEIKMHLINWKVT